jgi:tetratricopeptide (TPR) repeat protein
MFIGSMIFKYIFGFILFFIFLTSCQHKKIPQHISSNDSTSLYIQKALSHKTPYATRVRYTQKAVDALVLQENDSINRDRFIQLCRNFNDLNSWNNLKKTSKIFLLKSQEAGDEYFIGHSYRWMGVYYENKSMNDSAFYCYLKAERYFKKTRDKKMLAKLNLYKSTVQINVFDIYGAEKSAITSLKYANMINDKLQQYDAFVNLGIASAQSEDYSKAIYFVNKALLLANNNPQYNNLFLKEIALNNLAYYYSFQNNHIQASKIYKKAI